MITRHHTVPGLLLLAVAVAATLGGCRAFQPEAVLVNKPPETYIIGAPLEDSGGYYHFHVYWYGSDADGRVERFVWALTDTTVQDPDTSVDEEDQRFNPALDASTLEIGHWTTRTDSIFNFSIDQGVSPSTDMTLHMVAIDDFGDYDRTPARLHFFSNTLGNPSIRFARITAAGDTVALAPGKPDTVGFGKSYHLTWSGSTPNVRGYSPTALALLDTVPPRDDGLFGYKWLIDGALGGCPPSQADCWRPRRFNEATNDSFSYFGGTTSLKFLNDASGTSPFRRLLPSGPVGVQVNSIDVAGVEVATFMRPFTFVVNYDPETRILDGETDPEHPGDPETYPYYIRLNDPTRTHYPFRSGDRIPDRTYVVVKALARDNPEDLPLRPGFKIGFSGFLQGLRTNFFGGAFSFASDASVLDTLPAWDAANSVSGQWYGETLGFLTAPNSQFTINMQAVDEHGRRDGSPAKLSFDVGFPPCVQCIEVLPKTTSVSGFPPTVACVDDPANIETHPCFGDTTELFITNLGTGADELQFIQTTFMLVNKSTGFVTVTAAPTTEQRQLNYVIDARLYRMTVMLHGQDDDRERWAQPVRRIMGWKYEINYTCDIYNAIRDGGGSDALNEPTWGQRGDGVGLTVDPGSGIWKLFVDVAVPTGLLSNGPVNWKFLLPFTVPGITPEGVELVFAGTTKQFGLGWVDAVALDQTTCGAGPIRPATYFLFRNVRPPLAELLTGSWRDCEPPSIITNAAKTSLNLSQGAMASLGGQPVRKYFRLNVVWGSAGNTGIFVCTEP